MEKILFSIYKCNCIMVVGNFIGYLSGCGFPLNFVIKLHHFPKNIFI